MLSNAAFEAVAALILFVIAILGACGPLVLSKYGKKSKDGGSERTLAFVLGNMLSAGVMVAAGFVHLLGQAIVELPVPGDNSFPWAPFLCGVGFLSTLLADQYAEGLSEHEGGNATPALGALRCHGREGSSLLGPAPSMIVEHESAILQHVAVAGAWDDASGTDTASHTEQGPLTENGFEHGKHKQHSSLEMTQQQPEADSGSPAKPGKLASLAQPAPSGANKPSAGSRGGRAAGADSSSESDDDSIGEALLPSTARGRETSDSAAFTDAQEGGQGAAGGPFCGQGDAARGARGQSPGGASPRGEQPQAHRRHRGRHKEAAAVSFATAVLMAVALCFHSILEGAAMGAQERVVDILHIFIAIAAHKGLAAYALGSSLVDSKAEGSRFWTVIGAFAIATPVGILLGTLLARFASGRAAASLSALASGTFLYVAFMEVIPRELSNHDHRILKLLMLMLGFGSMSVLAIWA